MNMPDHGSFGRSTGFPITVLIVETNREHAARYVRHLQAQGLRAIQDGDAGADVLVPDVVIFGADSCADRTHAVRIFRSGRTVPTIGISSDERDRRCATAHGFASVLIRPVDFDLLLAEVQRLASRPTDHSSPSFSAAPDDPEYAEVMRVLERQEGQERRERSQRLRDRSKESRNLCDGLLQKSSDLLRESDVASRLHRRS